MKKNHISQVTPWYFLIICIFFLGFVIFELPKEQIKNLTIKNFVRYTHKKNSETKNTPKKGTDTQKKIRSEIRKKFPAVQIIPPSKTPNILQLTLQSDFSGIQEFLIFLENRSQTESETFEIRSLDFFSKNPDLVFKLEGKIKL